MSTSSEVEGIIIELDWDVGSYEFLLTLRYTDGRLLSVIYHFEHTEFAESIFKSLTKGMRVKLNVRGNVSDSETIYKGVGVIKIATDRNAAS